MAHDTHFGPKVRNSQGAVGVVLSALGCWGLRRGDSPVAVDTNIRS